MLKKLSASWACVVFSAANIFARSIGSTNWRRAQWRSRSHFLPDRRFSTPAIHSNNCFITGPSGNSLAASIALACSGGKSVNRGGIYLFFLPDSFRDVLSLSIYHCSQKLQPSSHNSVFPPCRITEIRVLFCFRKRQKPAQGYRRNSYLSANAVMLMAMSLKGKQKAIKAAPTKKPLIRIAVVESDPLRFAGFHALFDSSRISS